MKIGIYGGTFDPIHKGHMAAIGAAIDALGLDQMYLIPAGIPPHKQLSTSSADADDRLEMTKIAADCLQSKIPIHVLDIELRRGGKSFTSDTLLSLCKNQEQDEYWLLMGSDMFLTLHTWFRPDVILKLAGICAFSRSSDSQIENELARQKIFLTEEYPGSRIKQIQIPDLVETSSTEIRAQLQNGCIPDTIIPSIYGYIIRNQLYNTSLDLKHLTWEQLRCASYSMIKAKRIPHVRGTEETAVKLALKWGADPEQARVAAILHDCTKYLDLTEQLQLCGEYGILLDNVEEVTLKLLHAKTGAAVARHVYGVSDEVHDAIFWHTTGKADMTVLEKVIYIADYMEPSRAFEGVQILRELAESDLNAAVLRGLEMTVVEMQTLGSPVHRRTIEALTWLKENECKK